MDLIDFHLSLLVSSDFEGLGTALHPRYIRVTNVLLMRCTFGGFSMIYIDFIGFH